MHSYIYGKEISHDKKDHSEIIDFYHHFRNDD